MNLKLLHKYIYTENNTLCLKINDCTKALQKRMFLDDKRNFDLHTCTHFHAQQVYVMCTCA